MMKSSPFFLFTVFGLAPGALVFAADLSGDAIRPSFNGLPLTNPDPLSQLFGVVYESVESSDLTPRRDHEISVLCEQHPDQYLARWFPAEPTAMITCFLVVVAESLVCAFLVILAAG